MKDIGLKLKEKREENGVSVEEAAEDMKMRPSQIEALESGNREEFKDVGMLKYFIRDYAKYLGLDGEAMVDEFNEYLFDFTSKIPVNDIEKEKDKDNNLNKVSSPYTNMNKKHNGMKILGISILVIVILAIIGYVIISGIKQDDFSDDGKTYIISKC